MIRFKLPDSNWNYFYGVDNQQFYLDNSIMFILPGVTNQIFPTLTDKPLNIIDANIDGAPVCFSKQNLIFLSTAGVYYWAQNIYQIAHELCHYYICSDCVSKPMHFFEEILCDVSSHFFLLKIGHEFPKFTSLIQYHLDTINNVESFDLKKLFDDNSLELKSLKTNPYQREKLRYVTKLVLPIFQENPNLFSELQHMKKVIANPSFKQSLYSLKNFVQKENIQSIDKIIHIFQ